MFESVVTTVLNKFLGSYVDNLQSQQLSLGIWKGDVVLHNLRLRREALDQFNLPIDVVEGYMGDLILKIPWNDLKGKPVQVDLRNLYLLTQPKAETDYDPAAEEERVQRVKQEKLQSTEVFAKETEKQVGQSGFMASLVTKIVENVQISIKNIHIRYEDQVSHDRPFSAGITIEEVSAVTTNEDWEETIVHDITKSINKLLRLKRAAIYLNTSQPFTSLAGFPPEQAILLFMALIPKDGQSPNHQYLLRPVTGTGRLRIERGKPSLEGEAILQFDHFGFDADNEQLYCIMSLLSTFSNYLKGAKYRKYRPPRSVGPMIDPLAWFKYAGTCVLSDIRERNRRWTWAYMKERRDDRIAYVRDYEAYLLGNSTVEQREAICRLELKLSFQDIRFYRSLVMNRLRKAQVKLEVDQSGLVKEPLNPAVPQKQTWSEWWYGTATASQSAASHAPGTAASGDPDRKAVLSNEEIAHLYDAIDYDPTVPDKATEPVLPRQMIMTHLRVELKQGSFGFHQHLQAPDRPAAHEPPPPPAAAADASLEIPEGAATPDASLQSLAAPSRGDVFESPALRRMHSITESIGPGDDITTTRAHAPDFLTVRYFLKPFNTQSDSSVEIVMLPLEVIYNPPSIQAILYALNAVSPRSKFTEMASKLPDMEIAKERLGDALAEHSNIDVNIQLDAPIIIFPSGLADTGLVTVLDAGHLDIRTSFLDPKLRAQYTRRTKTTKDTASNLAATTSPQSHADPDAVVDESRFFYDRFVIKLTDVQLLMGRTVEGCLRDGESDDITHVSHADATAPLSDDGETVIRHVVERVNLDLTIDVCVLKNADMPHLKVSGTLPRLHLNLSDQKYKTFIKVAQSLNLDFGPARTEAELRRRFSAIGWEVPVSMSSSVTAAHSNGKGSGGADPLSLGNRYDIDWDVLMERDAAPIVMDSDPSSSSEPDASATATARGDDDADSDSDDNDNFYDAPDALSGVLAAYRQENIHVAFTMGSVSAAICKSLESPLRASQANVLSPDGEAERVLAQATVEGLAILYSGRLADYTVNVTALDCCIQDRMAARHDAGADPRRPILSPAATSSSAAASGAGDNHERNHLLSTMRQSDESWLVVDYHSVQRTHPEFDGLDARLSVSLCPTKTVFSRSSVLSLHDFILATFTGSTSPPPPPGIASMSQPGDADVSLGSTTAADASMNTSKPPHDSMMASMLEEDDATRASTSSSMLINVKLAGLHMHMKQDQTQAAFVHTAESHVAITLFPSSLTVEGKIGNVKTIIGHNHTFIDTSGDDVVNFKFVSLDPSCASHEQRFGLDVGYDSGLTMRASSLHILYSEARILELLAYLTEFRRMHVLLDSARQAAASSAEVIQKHAGRFHFDVSVDTPVLTMPFTGVTPLASHYADATLVLYPGKLVARNVLQPLSDDPPCTVNVITARLEALNIQCTRNARALHIMDRVDVEMTMQRPDHPIRGAPLSQIHVNISDPKIRLTSPQYQFILLAVNSITKLISGSSSSSSSSSSSASSSASETSSMAPGAPKIAEGPNKALRVIGDAQQQQAADNTTVSMDVVVNVDQIELELLIPRPPGSTTSSKPATTPVSSTPTPASASAGRSHEQAAPSRKTPSTTSLARFSLKGLVTKAALMQSGTLECEVMIRTITFKDSRQGVTSHFRELMPPLDLNAHPQFVMHISQQNMRYLYHMTLDTPVINLVIDHVFSIVDFFTTPATAKPAPPPASQRGDRPRNAVAAPTSSYRIELINSEFWLLQDPSNKATEAIIFHAKQISLLFDDVATLSAKQCGLFFCQMSAREETVRFVQYFHITVTYDGRQVDLQHLTAVRMNVTSLLMRVSSGDIALLNDVFWKVYQAYTNRVVASQAAAETSTTVAQQPASKLSPPSNLQRDLELLDHTPKTHVLARETAQIITQGLRIVITDDTTQLHLPVLDLVMDKLEVEIADWSSKLRVNVSIHMFVNYFNIRNSHWEPLVEPWQAFINVARQPETGGTSVEFFSRRKLDINITHAWLETVLAIARRPPRVGRHLASRRGLHAPYILRNKTGYTMNLWTERPGNGLDTEIKELGANAEMPWHFDDWRKPHDFATIAGAGFPNRIALQIQGPGWESLKGISLDREGERLYSLRPALKGVTYKLVIEVRLHENVKVVTFRSAIVMINATELNVDVILVNTAGKQSTFMTVAPGESCPLPIKAVYVDGIRIRPHNYGYNWSLEEAGWRDLAQRPFTQLTCKSYDGTKAAFRFQYAPRRRVDPTSYPSIAIRLCAPLQMQNLLPYDVMFSLFDKDLSQEFPGSLQKGVTSSIHTIDPTHLLGLRITLPPETGFMRKSDVAIITKSEFQYRDEEITLTDPEGRVLTLRLKYTDRLDLDGHKVTIYCPYVLLNKTGLDLTFSEHSLITKARIAAGQGGAKKPAYPDVKAGGSILPIEVAPFMFSFSNSVGLRSRAQVCIGNSEWSRPLSFDAIGSSTTTQIQLGDRVEADLGVTVNEGSGPFYLTKVVTFAPRYIIKNETRDTIEIKPEGMPQETPVPRNATVPLVTFLATEGQKRMPVQIRMSRRHDWSTVFHMNELGRIYLKCPTTQGQAIDLVRAEVTLLNATIFVTFRMDNIRWPHRIENHTDVDIRIRQYQSTVAHTVPRQTTMPWAWDRPSAPKKALILMVNGYEREVDILEIGQLMPFRYPTGALTPDGHRAGAAMAIRVFVDGATLVLCLEPYAMMPMSTASAATASTASNASSTLPLESAEPESFEIKQKEDSILMGIQIRLEGIGLSLINRHMKELLYASAKNVTFIYSDSIKSKSVSFSIKWLQIDNQLYGCMEPIFLYPTVIPKEGEEEPVLLATVSKNKDATYGVDYYNWFTILLQELSVDLDEDFLHELLDMFKFETPNAKEDRDKVIKVPMADFRLHISPPESTDDEVHMYFEQFLLQPIQFNLGFSKTQSASSNSRSSKRAQESEESRSFFGFVFDVLTMTIGNIHDAPIRLNALDIQHPIVTPSRLQDLIVQFYSQEIIGQIHKIIGSADFLGNPVGLFNNVSSGVSDLFYEPLQGFEITRPQDFGIGLAKGTASLFKKTVYGLTDTFSKFTGSVSKGLAVVTLDDEYQQRRRITHIRNRPSHAVYGVTNGAQSFARSVASGITGVVSKPFEGAERDGVGGFFKGLGKGLVGVVAKPVIGVFDLATNVSEGIRNTTTVFDAVVDRVRDPRNIGKDGILKPYDPAKALGLNWLKSLENGRYLEDEYIAHIELHSEDLVAMVTDYRIMVIRVKKLKVDWEIFYDDIQSMRPENGGITIIKQSRQQAKARFIPCPDINSAKWLFAKMELAYSQFLE
ncbi:hypothetical protein CXG81DRAFT_9373 [Caulochytrium protostelioides]|uniref:Vacuolar protein sorting-associated protein n=1 Tax=Caulochytrium protostelioides TaxID=1555241 RepID=A0A4P9XDH4_9FUNG|nr:hypothetical protein CXG81DRAFT_9373 [Caulochytrium protostelioides]|eukprot:RKP03518.1 hypothetical protein CXG81DRAFT_9373 [Caulochytrium protostelioides]